jgi:Archaeal enzymes of ATP-grasp superfamily
MIISAAGIVNNESEVGKSNDAPNGLEEQAILAVGSTPSTAKIIKENGFIPLRSGSIGGIPATLLNEGSLTGQGVIVLIVNTILDAPDFRAAALISDAVIKLIPGLSCDVGSLLGEAQVIESKMKQIRDNHKKSSYIA